MSQKDASVYERTAKEENLASPAEAVLHCLTLGIAKHKANNPAPAPSPLSPKLARRLCELDATLDLDIPSGSGFAEATMGDAVKGIMAGEDSGILDGWECAKGKKWTKARLAELGAKWKAEDAATARKEGK